MTPTEYRQHRKQLDLTQDQLAKRIGLNKVTISNRERGDAIPVEAQLAMSALIAETQPEKRALGVITGTEKMLVDTMVKHSITVMLPEQWSYAILGRLVEVNAQPDVERSSDAS